MYVYMICTHHPHHLISSDLSGKGKHPAHRPLLLAFVVHPGPPSLPPRTLLGMRVFFVLRCTQTFKVLKHGGTDYDLLKMWCLLGLLRVFEEYFEVCK